MLAASAERPIICTLVMPVSKAKLSMIDVVMASRVIITSSSACRPASADQLLVWCAWCPQSNCRSSPTSACGKLSWIWPWRHSSSTPKVAMLRMAGAFANRAMRAEASAVWYSDSAIAA